jgi:prophage antirepressor-like protein
MGTDIIQTICGVRGYEKDGVAYLHIEDVARGLGFTTTTEKGGVEYTNIRWSRVEECLHDLNFLPLVAENENPHDYYIPENIFYRLCMKAKNAVAEAFQTKVADEIIPSIRRHGMYATDDFIQRSISDPDWAISVLQQLKFEREQKELALRQRDEAVRTKYHFVEGRDAEMCGRVGGLTNANIQLREKNSTLATENDKLKDEAGRGRNYKQAKNIPWLKEYFNVRKNNFYSQCGKVLSEISKELNKNPLIYENNDYNIKCYHISVIEEFKRRLEAGVIFAKLKNYYKTKGNNLYNNRTLFDR